MWYILFLITALVIWNFFFNRPLIENSGKCIYLDKHQISAKELFEKIKEEITERHLPVTMEIKSILEDGILSSKREFLHIAYKDYVIDITCGFFGDGSYVGWHSALKGRSRAGMVVRRWMLRHPLLSANPNIGFESFHRVDTKGSLDSLVRKIYMEEVQSYSEINGIRPIFDEPMPLSPDSKAQLV